MTVQILLVRLVSAYLRAVPWSVGRWRLVLLGLRLIRRHGARMGTAVVRTKYGFRMALQLHDWVDQHIYVTGNYEDETAATIAELVQRGDLVVDIGANIGFFSLLMAERVGAAGAVWSFEPCPPTRQRLTRNIELNHATQVQIRAEAISDADGQATFHSGSDTHSGIASLRPLADSSGAYEVQTRRLPAVPGLTAASLIKMDVEGAEHLALRGMEDWLEQIHPDLVLEVSDPFLRQMGSSAADVCAFLTKMNYRMFMIDWDGLVRCEGWSTTLPTQFNALFTIRQELPPGVTVKH